jgi:long-chain fatty acid transport protein
MRFEGLALPRQLELGLAWQARPGTLITAKFGWLNWAGAMRRAVLTASTPDSAAVPASLTVENSLDWRNQRVYAIGLEHALTERLRLRAGFNFGRTPVPPHTMQPVLAAIHERHITGGVGYDHDRRWKLSGAFEFQPGKKVTYTNPELPFGANTGARNRYLGVILMASYLWD